MTCACKLDKPERLRRLPRLNKRFSEISNAYKRPVFFIKAPIASVLPPAPAQKSATIWPRFGATKYANNWLPSSCTSILPASNNTCLLMFKRAPMRMPIGEYGVTSITLSLMVFSANMRANTSSRVPLMVFTRKSSAA